MESCPDDSRLGSAFDSGSPDEELFEHLAACPRCQRRLEAQRRSTPHQGILTDSSGVIGLFRPSQDTEPAVPNFEIIREIRRGGQGVVYEAHDSQANRRVALKTILASTLGSETRVARFEREITLIAGLDHSGIVRLYQSGRLDDGSLYFAMEYIDGQDLNAYIAERGPIKSREDVNQCLRLFRKICEAIAHAHSRGIAHRDLKPSNIRIDSEGLPHVLDFGLAKQLDSEASDDLTRSVEFVGTVQWATPEQTPWVEAPIDTRADVYALGHLLYWMLSMKHPYRTDGSMLEVLGRIGNEKAKALPLSVSSLVDGRDLESVIGHALEKDPRDRYPTVVDLAEDCTNLLEGRPIGAQRSGTFRAVVKLTRRHPALASAMAMAITILCVACFWLYQLVQSADRREALLKLATIQPKNKPTSYRKSAEREAWTMLLTGSLEQLSSPPTGPDDFPGSAGLLDVMRGLYVDMPILGTVQTLDDKSTMFPLDSRGGLGSHSEGPDGTAHISRHQLPYLEGEDFSLELRAAFRYRADLSREHLYAVMEEGMFRFNLPLQQPAVATAMDDGQGRWGKYAKPIPGFGHQPQFAPSSFLEALKLGQVSLDSEHSVLQPYSDSLVMAHERNNLRIYSLVEAEWEELDISEYLKPGMRLDRLWTGVSLTHWDGDATPLMDSKLFEGLWGQIDVIDKQLLFASGVQVRAAAIGIEGNRKTIIFTGRSIGEAITMRLLPSGESKQKAIWGHSGPVSRVLVTPSGELFLTEDSGGIIRCWDSEKVLDHWLEPMASERQRGTNVFGVHAFSSHNGSVVLAGQGESYQGRGTVQFLPQSGEPAFSISPTRQRVSGVALIPGTDGVFLFAPEGGELMTWEPQKNPTSWDPLPRPGCPENERSQSYNFLAVDPSTGRIAAAAGKNTVHLLQFSNGRLDSTQDLRVKLKSLGSRTGPGQRIPAVAWRPGINTLAVALYSGELSWIHDGKASDPHWFHAGAIRTVAASPDGSWLVAGSDDGCISFWEWRATKPSFSLQDAHPAPVFALAFDEDSRCLASADRSGLIQIWDVSTWPGVDPQLIYRIDADLTTVLALEWGRGERAGELYIGGCKKLGPLVWNAESLNEFVAGNFEYWAKNLEEIASPSIVREMRTWSDAHKAR